jgi:hypothetical protein
MDQGENAPFSQGFFNLGMAENDLAGLIGHGESAQSRLGQERVDVLGQAFGRLGLGLERTAEGLALDRLGDRVMGGCKPDAAAGKLLFEVRDDAAVGPEDEAQAPRPLPLPSRPRAPRPRGPPR